MYNRGDPICSGAAISCHQFVQGGSVGIRVNDNIGHYFQTLEGLHQGDPLSLILFNTLARAKKDGQVRGSIPHIVEDGISILQYTDDTILFMKHDLAKAINMKLILSFFRPAFWFKVKLS
jgi:hypothetical protein